MTTQRFDLGETPTLRLGTCNGDLEIRGASDPEILIETDGIVDANPSPENILEISAINGSGCIRLPDKAQLHIGQVGGSLRLKGVLSMVGIDRVGGDCVARRIGALNIGEVGGEMHIRHADGDLVFGQIGGDVSLRDAGRPVRIETIGGDFTGREISSGLMVGHVGGDLSLRSSFHPEAHYTFDVEGDILLRVASDSGARIVMPARTNLNLDEGLQVSNEGEAMIVMIGSGGATVNASARGDVLIRSGEPYGTDEDFGFAFDEDFNSYLNDVSTKLDSGLRRVEVRLGKLPDRVRQRVERKLSAARKHVEAAQRHAREATERAESQAMRHELYREAARTAARPPVHETVSDAERLLVLQMLEEGKITVEEAQKLLATLEGGVQSS